MLPNQNYSILEVFMSKPAPDLEAAQIAEILDYLQKLRPHHPSGAPLAFGHIRKKLSPTHAKAELGDLSAPALFYRMSVPLYARQTPMTMGEYSKAQGVPLSTATRFVDWLAKHGYAERSSDPSDRRVVLVSLTRSGRELFEAMNLTFAQKLERILKRLTPTERKQFVSLVRRIAEIIESEE